MPLPQPHVPAPVPPQPRPAPQPVAPPLAPQVPVPPQAPGGGALQQPQFSGDHVLESVARGIGALRPGASGAAVRAVQAYLVAAGVDLGRGGVDGSFGPGTVQAVKAWQAAHGLAADGVVGKVTLLAMDGAAGAGAHTGPSAAAGGPTGLPKNFDEMWAGHPHNYQDDSGQNTASSDVLTAQGWDPEAYGNTCAIRMSVMFNNLGGAFRITRDKAKAAGIAPGRVPYSQKTGWFYILSAAEMWTYISKWCGQPSVQFPARGRFAGETQFQSAFDSQIAPAVAGHRGIVAFDKIFTYAGTGHVDLFDGQHLSDSSIWYPSASVRLWYV